MENCSIFLPPATELERRY